MRAKTRMPSMPSARQRRTIVLSFAWTLARARGRAVVLRLLMLALAPARPRPPSPKVAQLRACRGMGVVTPGRLLSSLAMTSLTTSRCRGARRKRPLIGGSSITQGDADDDTALFEYEWGSEGTKHVALADVDFFCTPRVRARLELALLQAHVGKVMEGGVA